MPLAWGEEREPIILVAERVVAKTMRCHRKERLLELSTYAAVAVVMAASFFAVLGAVAWVCWMAYR